MLHHPTLDLLDELGLHGCAKGLRELENTPTAGLSHTEWLGLLLEYEVTRRNQKRFESRARRARLRHAAVLAMRRCWRTSTSERRVGSTARCS